MAGSKNGLENGVYDKDSGFVYIVNLCIIRTIYYDMKGEKDSKFLKETTGRKVKSKEVYGGCIPFSRQRFGRMMRGEKFRFSTQDAKAICELYGMDKKYFEKDSPKMIEIPNIIEKDWICFLNVRYEVSRKETIRIDKEEKDRRALEVEKALRRIAKRNWEGWEDAEEPLFLICYYFRNGKKYEKKSNAEKIDELLAVTDYMDWYKYQKGGIEKLKNCYIKMQKHCNYMKALLTIHYMSE